MSSHLLRGDADRQLPVLGLTPGFICGSKTLPLNSPRRELCWMPTSSSYSVLMSRILFKDNTDENLIRFQQEDLNWETGANFPVQQAGNESSGILRHF